MKVTILHLFDQFLFAYHYYVMSKEQIPYAAIPEKRDTISVNIKISTQVSKQK